MNGGTNTTTYHRRKLSKLWDYIKGKLNTHDVKLANYNIGGSMSFQDLYLRETVTFFSFLDFIAFSKAFDRTLENIVHISTLDILSS